MDAQTKTLGEWTFIPCKRRPTGISFRMQVLPDQQTIAEESIIYNNGTAYVRGHISRDYHNQLLLNGWHKAVRS